MTTQEACNQEAFPCSFLCTDKDCLLKHRGKQIHSLSPSLLLLSRVPWTSVHVLLLTTRQVSQLSTVNLYSLASPRPKTTLTWHYDWPYLSDSELTSLLFVFAFSKIVCSVKNNQSLTHGCLLSLGEMSKAQYPVGVVGTHMSFIFQFLWLGKCKCPSIIPLVVL